MVVVVFFEGQNDCLNVLPSNAHVEKITIIIIIIDVIFFPLLLSPFAITKMEGGAGGNLVYFYSSFAFDRINLIFYLHYNPRLYSPLNK